MSVKLNKNQSTITNTFNPVFQGKCQCRTLWYIWDPIRHHWLSKWYHQVEYYWAKLIGLRLKNSIVSIIQHFHVGELDCVVHFGELENLKFFTKEWLYWPEIYLGTLQGQFTRGNETGCSSGKRSNDLNTSNQRL